MKRLIPFLILFSGCVAEHSQYSYRDPNVHTFAPRVPVAPTITVGDRVTRMKIRSKYALDHIVDKDEVQVAASGGTVTLYGIVSSRDAKRRAIEIARETKGVRIVNADLKVFRKKEKPRPRRRYR